MYQFNYLFFVANVFFFNYRNSKLNIYGHKNIYEQKYDKSMTKGLHPLKTHSPFKITFKVYSKKKKKTFRKIHDFLAYREGHKLE